METTQDLNDLITKLQNGALAPITELFGIPVDFEPESLEVLEELINELWHEGTEPMPTTLIPFGFILGETMIRNLTDAKWVVDDANHFMEISVEIKMGEGTQKVYPFLRVHKFFHDRTDGLAVMYRMTNLFQLKFLDPKNIDSNEWVDLPNGDRYRMTTVDKNETEEGD